jgi:hypothetical protein
MAAAMHDGGAREHLADHAKKQEIERRLVGHARRIGRDGEQHREIVAGKALAEHPDRIIEATLSACPHCAYALGSADQPDIHAYDHIELPAISPIVTRINRHRGVCPCCRRQVTAPAPKGFEPGSPFGRDCAR